MCVYKCEVHKAYRYEVLELCYRLLTLCKVSIAFVLSKLLNLCIVMFIF